MRRLLVGLAIAGCASAGKGNSVVGGLTDGGIDGPHSDADDFPEPDASPIDAPPQQVTLSQTTSATIARQNTFICFDNVTGFTRQNSYYRVFTLADHSITTTLHVTEVGFAIQEATSGFASQLQPARVTLGAYAGPVGGTTLDLTQVRTLAMADIQIPDGMGTRMTVPITADVAPNQNLIVELTAFDGRADGHAFVIGSNPQGESKPGYTRAPSCDITAPTTMKSIATEIGEGEADIILIVTATTSAPT